MPGPSNWTAAFTHPDPMDPNDRVRQKTQSRSKGDGGKGTGHQGYPYDQPTSYGKAIGTDMGGAAYQIDGDNRPPPGEEDQPDRPLSVWDRMSDAIDREEMGDLNPTEIGPMASNAASLGYGNHGRMGEDGMDPFDLELDTLKKDFRDSYVSAMPVTDRMGPGKLFILLTQLDPDFSAETFAPEDEDEMRSIYGLWADRMSGPEEEPDEDQDY